MEQEVNKNLDFKGRLISSIKGHKVKFIIGICTILFFSLAITFYKINENKKNILISEKYIQAGLNLAAGEKVKSKKILEQIIVSKNKFYSILALNIVLERNLEEDQEKILNYFKILENLSLPKDHKDLLILKKGLYLIKISKIDEGKSHLKKLIDGNTKFKTLAEEILIN